jgi:putative SOS response-associated peptidase YedK
MCNLYSMRKPRDEVLGLFNIAHADVGAQYDLPAVFPDTIAPIIKLDENGARHLTMMRWGFPPNYPLPAFTTLRRSFPKAVNQKG